MKVVTKQDALDRAKRKGGSAPVTLRLVGEKSEEKTGGEEEELVRRNQSNLILKLMLTVANFKANRILQPMHSRFIITRHIYPAQ